jgi:hypothetical protein
LKVYLGSKAAETAKFVDNFDKFFDCLNVDNFNSGHTKRKPFLEPYRAADDFRIKWLKDFLLYLDEWEKSVQARPGYDNKQKKQMILSAETLLGIRMTGKISYKVTDVRNYSVFLSFYSDIIHRAGAIHI